MLHLIRISFVAIALAAASLCAQDPVRVTPLRIAVDKDGLHQVSFADLAPHIDPSRVPPKNFGIFRDGVEIPIEIRGGADGAFDRSDAILFYGERGRTSHSRESVYVLKAVENGRRIDRLELPREAEPITEGERRITAEEDVIFHPLPCVIRGVIREELAKPSWFWKRIPAPVAGSGETPYLSEATFVIPIETEPQRSSSARIQIELRGALVPKVRQKIQVSINGKEIGTTEWDTPLDKALEFRVPPQVLTRNNAVQIRNLSPMASYEEPNNEVHRRVPNALLIDRITIDYPAFLLGTGFSGVQTQYRIQTKNLKIGDVLDWQPSHKDGFLLYDIARAAFLVRHQVKVEKPGEEIRVCCTSGGYHAPVSITPLNITRAHLAGPGGDYVIITTSRLRPLLQNFVVHKQSRGHEVIVVEARELYDTFTAGRFDPKAFAAFVRAAHKNWKTKPKSILLVGDADYDVDFLSVKETLPATLVMTDYNGASATDALIGDINQDGIPELAVGRLPVREPENLLRVLARIADYESNPERGTWRRNLRFVAGEARFSPTIDALLEKTTRSILASEIPPGFRVGLTRAQPKSPYFWPGASFAERFAAEMSSGCFAFTYIGHGSPTHLDSLRQKGERYPIFDLEHVARVNAGKKPPIVTFIACWTGEYDRPERDCLAERLFVQEGGPIAVIASSRVSHPFPDALFGLGLSRSIFSGKSTLGDVLLEAKSIMIRESEGALGLIASPFLSSAVESKSLVKDHLYLYNLLGDPALSLPIPTPITLEIPKVTASGIEITGTLPKGSSGKLLLTLERPTGVLSAEAESEPTPEDRPEPAIIALHGRANDPTFTSIEIDATEGPFAATLPLPTTPPSGRYLITAYLTATEGRDALGATSITIP